MSSKYSYNLFFIILSLILLYSPLAYASDVVNSFVAALESIVFLNPVSLIIGTAVTCGQGDCAGYYDKYVSDVGCRWRSSNDIGFSSYCNTNQILTIGPGTVSSCQPSTLLTFYNDVGPPSPDEQNSTVQIFRATHNPSGRYWPWYDPYNDAGARNADLINWLTGFDQQVGDGLFSPYNWKEGSYFISAQSYATMTPLAEVPYSRICNAQGVCKVIDQAVSKNVDFAYMAKIKDAVYKFKVPTEDKVVYDIQAECPTGSTSSVSRGKLTCIKKVRSSSSITFINQSVSPIYYLNYNSGRIPILSDNNGQYILDGNNKKIYAVSNKLELLESQKPWNLEINYPIGVACPQSYTDQNGQCRKSDWRGQISTANPSYSINYNGGNIPVTAETDRLGHVKKYYLTDAKGKNIDAVGSEFRINDLKLNNELEVTYKIEDTCTTSISIMGRQTTCSAPYSINYNGGEILVSKECTGTVQLGRCYGNTRYFITDANSNKLVSLDGATFKLKQGLPTSSKFSVKYKVAETAKYDWRTSAYGSLSSFSLPGYNGGTLMAGPVYTFNASQYDNQNEGTYFYFGGTKYKYNGQTEWTLVVDESTPSPAEVTVERQGKFLTSVSGQAVTDTTSNLPYGWSKSAGILGPFAPINEVTCPAVSAITQAPIVVQATCNSVTLESAGAVPVNVLKRVKGSTTFTTLQKFDFSAGGTFTDSNLTPHTTYEYALQDPISLGGTILDNQIMEAYTFCRPSCKILSESATIPEFSSVDFKWQCASDTVPISCQLQSDDPNVGTKSGLNLSGTLKFSPSQDSRYTLTCNNVDGLVTLTPFKVDILKPGIKEVKP